MAEKNAANNVSKKATAKRVATKARGASQICFSATLFQPAATPNSASGGVDLSDPAEESERKAPIAGHGVG